MNQKKLSRAKKVELTSNNEEQATKKKGRGALQRERKRKAKESGSESIVEKKLRKDERGYLKYEGKCRICHLKEWEERIFNTLKNIT